VIASKRLIVTGASGYIGRRVVVRAADRGVSVEAWSRRPVEGASCWRSYDLAAPLPACNGAPCGILHLAADLSASLPRAVEAGALQALLELARKHDVPLIYVSSQTALRPGSEYGYRKQALEHEALAAGATVARPGLVVGGVPPGAAAQSLRRLSRLPVHPRFVPAVQLQLVHVDDLVDGLFDLLSNPRPGEAIEFGGKPLRLERVLFEYREALGLRPPMQLPVPRQVVRLMLRSLPGQRFAQASSLLSLKRLENASAPSRPLQDLIAWRVRPERRRLIVEGYHLLRFVADAAPRSAVKRYVRILEDRGGTALDLPVSTLQSRLRLAVLEQGERAEPLGVRWRIAAALALAEASAGTLDKFYLQEPIGRVRAWWLLSLAFFGFGARLGTAGIVRCWRRSDRS